MKSLIPYMAALALPVLFSSCSETEDPGPLQETETHYNIEDFDRLEIGDAMQVTVEQGNYFEITVRGDRRNVDDIDAYKEGSTLIVRFDENRNRRHDTYIRITMPDLRAVNFSGACNSVITGFDDLSSLDISLSGASSSQVDADASDVDIDLSGASILTLRGSGGLLEAEASGASVLRAFDFPVSKGDVNASGASTIKVNVETALDATATGASSVLYRGSPTVNSRASDTSTIRHE